MQETTLQSTMARHYEDWKRSGLSQIGYCTLHGLGFAKFNYWVRKFRVGKSVVDSSGFLSVEGTPSGMPILEVTRRDGHVLRFFRGADAGLIRSLLV